MRGEAVRGAFHDVAAASAPPLFEYRVLKSVDVQLLDCFTNRVGTRFFFEKLGLVWPCGFLCFSTVRLAPGPIASVVSSSTKGDV